MDHPVVIGSRLDFHLLQRCWKENYRTVHSVTVFGKVSCDWSSDWEYVSSIYLEIIRCLKTFVHHNKCHWREWNSICNSKNSILVIRLYLEPSTNKCWSFTIFPCATVKERERRLQFFWTIDVPFIHINSSYIKYRLASVSISINYHYTFFNKIRT